MAVAPLLTGAAINFAPALIAKLFGDPNRDLRQQVQKLLDPRMFAKLRGEFFQSNIHSPAFGMAERAIAGGANVASANVARALQSRGLGSSGTGAVVSSLTPSLVGSQKAGLLTAADQSAGAQANQSIQQQIATLLGTQGPSPAQSLFAGGVESFGPLLQAFLRSKYPNIFGTLGQTPTATQ